MWRGYLAIVCICCQIISTESKPIAPFSLKTCNKSDPDLNDCVRESLVSLLLTLKNGIEELEVPPIDPLSVTELNLALGGGDVNLLMTMTEVIVRGLSQTEVVSVKTNVEDGKLEISTRTPRLEITGRYKGEGGVRYLPLSGDGNFNVSMVDVTSAWMVYYREVELPVAQDTEGGSPEGEASPERGDSSERGTSAGLGMEVETFALDVMPSKVSYYFDHFLDGDNGLASFMKPCAQNDPDISKCATASAMTAVPIIKNGIPEYGVTVLDPLTINEIKFNKNALGLDMTFRDVRIFGLGDSIVKNIQIELEPLYFKWHLIAPKLQLLGRYEADGRILLLPIQGKGPFNVTLDNVDYIYSFKNSLVKKSDGQEYLVPKPSNIDYQIGRAYFKLENLFNGNKLLGKELNMFLNESWKEVVDQLGPSLVKTIASAIQRMVENLTSRVPFDKIFPEKI